MSESEKVRDLVLKALDDIKAVDVVVMDVRGKSGVTDFMVIASGTSSRHLNAVAGSVIDEAKSAGIEPLGIEGQNTGEWVLVDLCDVVVHLMMPATRDFYQLEKLWEAGAIDEMAGLKPGA